MHADRAAPPKTGNRAATGGVERMLRMYFSRQWFNLSDPAVEEALYDSVVMRDFVGIDLGQSRRRIDDDLQSSAICWKSMVWVGRCWRRRTCIWKARVRITTGTIVDATIIHAPSSTRTGNRSATRKCTRPGRGSSGTSDEGTWAWTARRS